MLYWKILVTRFGYLNIMIKMFHLMSSVILKCNVAWHRLYTMLMNVKISYWEFVLFSKCTFKLGYFSLSTYIMIQMVTVYNTLDNGDV